MCWLASLCICLLDSWRYLHLVQTLPERMLHTRHWEETTQLAWHF